ncbi:thioredoxin [Buchnera aphidicola]|uniref:thioredoxin n=1 Tax=Buchnera aphidicola TaxID=9 RepID=UPI003464740F
MSNYIVNVTNVNFDTIVLKNKKPLILDFWAEWCSPCKIFLPILEEISKEYKNSLQIAKVNVDDCKEITEKYSIQSIPTILFFNNKKFISSHSGVISIQELKKLLHLHFNIT